MNIMPYVGVIYKDDKKIGSGFVIDPENRLLVTARHVISKYQPDLDSSLDGFSFEFFEKNKRISIKSQVSGAPREHEDIVILELADNLPKSLLPPRLISYVKPTDDVYVVGYVDDERKGEYWDYKSAQGKLSGYTVRNGTQVFQLDIDGIYTGMSGAPVMLGDKGIIGVLTHQVSEASNQTALVTPIEFVANIDNRILTPRRKYLENLLRELSEVKAPVEFPEYLRVAATVAPSPNDNDREFFTDIFQIAEQHKKINFVGAAGSGKTTALQQLALRMGKQALENLQSPVPIWINLSFWTIKPDQYFSDFIEGYINRTSYKSIKDFYPLEDLISDNKVVFFFDEFDQVTENFKDFREWVDKNNVGVYTSCRDTYFSKSRRLDIPTAYLEPLQTIDIFKFAKIFLDDKQLAEDFVSLIAPDANIVEKQLAFSQVSQIASNPLFLALMLRDYKENRYWKTSRQETVIPTLWKLFENIIVSLWESPRIQDAINQSHFLELQFADARGIVYKLAEIAKQAHRNSLLDQKNLEEHFPREIIEAFLDAHILKVDTSTRSYQFVHSLFVDFLVANHINLDQIDKLIKKPEWLSPLFILATRGNDERRFIQDALLEWVREEKDFHVNKVSSSIAVQMLGSLGDDIALGSLIDIYKLRPEQAGILKPIAQIANRLHHQSKERIKAIDLLKTIMFSANWMMDENKDMSDEILYELDWFWGDYVTATEAMSYIKSPDALDAILTVLEKSAHFFADKFTGGDHMRQEWFSQYLSSMGEWAIPRLVESLESDHPHITVTVAKALLRINRPLDIGIIGKLALTHPNPMVRAQLALTLGRIRALDSIPYLEEMLQDMGIWSTLGIGMQRHHIVADYAADSLAYIRKPEALSALKKNNYAASGDPTTELFLERMTCGISINNQFPLPTQIATTLLHRGEVDKLLPLLGHVHACQLWDYIPMCPVAKAIVDYCSEAKYEVGVTAHIAKYLESSTDTQSCKWALVVLGYVGDAHAMPVLRKYLDSKISQMADAAAYGFGVFISRNTTNNHDAMNLIGDLGAKINSLMPASYMGIGLGLSKIIKSYSSKENNFPDAVALIRDLLLSAFDTQTKQARMVSLDVLETICVENPDFLTDEIASVVNDSPSYHLKEAHRLYENEQFSEMHPILRSRVDYADAMAMYKLVFPKNSSTKNNVGYEKLADINWDDLNIHWGYVHSQIAKIYIVDENWNQAYDSFVQVVKFLNASEQSPFNHYLRIYAYSELGNLLCRFLNRPEDALPYFDMALSEFKLLPEQETRNVDLLSVFCNAMLNHQNFLIERQESAKIVQVGQDIKHLLRNIRFLPDDDLAIIFLSTAVELTRQYQFSDALEYTEIAHARLRKSANWKLKISSLLKIAELRHAIDKAEDVEPIILEARNIAKKHGDTLSEAFCFRNLAHNTDLDKDTKKAITYYENALSLFGNANDEKLLEEKAGIYHELAVLYQKQGDYEKSEETFIKAIDHVKKITPVFPNMPYVIQSEYAKLLSATGRHQQAIEFLLALSQEMLAKGLTPGIVGQTLQEIDTPPGHQMPFSAAERWASSLVKTGSGEIDREDYEQKLQAVFGEVLSQGLQAESEFFSGLLDILHDTNNITLTDENPYFEFYRSAKEQYSEVSTDSMDTNLSEIEMYIREGNFENAGILYFGLAQNFALEDDIDNALQSAQMALECFRKSGTQELIGGTLGFMYTVQMQKTNRYINSVTESIRDLEREGNFELAHQQRFELSKALADKGDYDSSLSQANEIRMYYEKLGDTDSVQRTIVLIATVQSIRDVREGNLDEVDAKIKKYILENNFLYAGTLRLTIASSLANDAEYETARKYIDAANHDFEQIGYSEGQWMARQYLERINKLTE